MNLSAATDLNSTTLQKEYPNSVYKHYQVEDAKGKEIRLTDDQDDFFSPMKPQDYIDLRLTVKMKFYQKKIPTLVRVRMFYQVLIQCLLFNIIKQMQYQNFNFFQLLVFSSSAACAILSSYNLTNAVVIITSLSAGILSSYLTIKIYFVIFYFESIKYIFIYFLF